MENLKVNVKDLSGIMSLLIEKIQILDSDIFTKPQKIVHTKEMLEIVDDLRTFFIKATDSKNDECNRMFVEKIERAFSQFEWNTTVAVSPSEFNKFSENGKLLISSILKLLGPKGCGILIIETYLKFCLKTTLKMTEKSDINNLGINKLNFKLLLDGFSLTVNMLKKFWHIAFLTDQKNAIMLCLHQISKFLPYLLKMIESQNSDMKKYALNSLTEYLIRIQNEIHSSENLNSNFCGQEFIRLVDFSLYNLNELLNYTTDIQKADTTISVLKCNLDEVLCYVMSIAQVTMFEDDHSAILASSQKVLQEFQELSNQVKEENICAVRLNAESVGESICNLEQKVNTAVLKLVLEVFSNVNLPLKNILNKCRNDISKDNKASEDLNDLISEFDLEMDRIMQIGFFTISCTTSLNRILEIQSCLASLESLETELILSLTALYVSCSSKHKENFQCLFDFWLKEITELKVLIDSVVDLPGFCGVVKNQIKSLEPPFKELCSPNFCINKLKENLRQAVRYSKKLIRTIKISMEDENETVKSIEDYFKKFQLAVQECEAVLDLMNEEITNKKINQAVKRYDFLMQTIEKLSSHLYFSMSDENTQCNEKENLFSQPHFSEKVVPKKNYYKLCELPEATVAPCNSIPEILTPYMNKSLLRSKRCVLYATPIQLEKSENTFLKTLCQTKYWDKTPLSSKRSRYCKPLTQNLELENTIDFEFTAILDNVSHLSNTFCKSLPNAMENQTKPEKEEEKNCKDVSGCSEKSTKHETPMYTSTGCCANFDLENDSKSNKEGEESQTEEKFLGFKLRTRFLQTLNDLSHMDSLTATNGSEPSICGDNLSSRMNDLRIVEEKINFLRSRMPIGLP